MLAKMRRNWISHRLLMGVQNGRVILERQLGSYFYKVKHTLTI